MPPSLAARGGEGGPYCAHPKEEARDGGDVKGIKVPTEGQLDQAWILATALGDHLITPSKTLAGQRDPLGHAVGVVIARLARSGFEEVAIFSLRRAWRNAEKLRKGGGSPSESRSSTSARTKTSR